MAKAIVSDSALRELLREALENEGAMGHDTTAPVTPNPVVDRTSMELDFAPVEVKSLPRTKNELIVMVRNLLDHTEDDQSGELYKKIKNIIGGDDAGKKDYGRATELPPGVNPVDRSKTTMKKNESKLVNAIKNIVEEALSEALPFGFGKGKMGLGDPADEEEGPEEPDFKSLGGSADDDFGGTVNFDPKEDETDDGTDAFVADMRKILDKSVWDDDSPVATDDDDDEGGEDDEEKPVAKGSPKKRVDLGTGYGVEGDTFEKIGEKMGFTPEAAKKAVAVAAERFKVLHDMDPEDLNDMVYDGLEEYIKLLDKTGELTPEDVKYMKKHADHLMDSDSFREFFSKYVKRAVREERADTQDDE